MFRAGGEGVIRFPAASTRMAASTPAGISGARSRRRPRPLAGNAGLNLATRSAEEEKIAEP